MEKLSLIITLLVVCIFSAFIVSAHDDACRFDFNKDGIVNETDSKILTGVFGSSVGDKKYNITYDLNEDEVIDFLDFLMFVQNYGKICVIEPLVDADSDCFGKPDGVQAGNCRGDSYCYAGSCCGNDADEYFVYQKAGTSPYIEDNPSKGKCYVQEEKPDFCLFADDGKRPDAWPSNYAGGLNNKQYKYNHGQIAGSISGRTWRGAVCNNGVWDELCDVNENACNTGCGVQWETTSIWMDDGDFCCGDDSFEFYIEGEDKTSACCAGKDYFVENGNCVPKIHDVSVDDIDATSNAHTNESVEVKTRVINLGNSDENVDINFYVDEEVENTKVVHLEKDQTEDISFFWKAVQGVHKLLVKVFVGGDVNESDNEAEGEINVFDDCHISELGSWNYCSPDCKCGKREGDCDSDQDCRAGLKCVSDAGEKYGFDNTVDVCEPVSSYVKHYEKKCYNGSVWWYDSNDDKNDKYENCEFGCENGKCTEEPKLKEYICEDSDGGLDFYEKGRAKNSPFTVGYRDCCKESSKGACVYNEITDYLHEGYCDGNIPKRAVYECPNGCYNGACIQ